MKKIRSRSLDAFNQAYKKTGSWQKAVEAMERLAEREARAAGRPWPPQVRAKLRFDTADLSKLAVAKAQFADLSAEIRKMAREVATSGQQATTDQMAALEALITSADAKWRPIAKLRAIIGGNDDIRETFEPVSFERTGASVRALLGLRF